MFGRDKEAPPPPPPAHPRELFIDEKWDRLLDLT
jgi:hypothetical protein